MESIQELRKICQTKPHLDPWMSRHFNRHISIYITRVLLLLGFSANQVTILGLVLGVGGTLLFFTGKLGWMLMGGLLLIFSYVLDSCDGEVARYRKMISLTGMHIDQIAHQLLLKFAYFGVAYGVFINTGYKSVLIFGFLCTIFSSSLVFNTLSLELIKIAIRSGDKIYAKGYVEKYKSIKKRPSKFIFGETKGKFNKLFTKAAAVKVFWTDPFDKLMILFTVIIEIINIRLQLFQSYTALYYLVAIYGILYTLMQVSSFIIHIQSKTIEQYHADLFKKK